MAAERGSWPDDQTLVHAIIHGDRNATETFYQKFQRLVHGMAWKFAHNGEEAKDLCQENWVQLFLTLPRWQPSGALGGWVTTVAVRKALEWSRQHEKRADKSGGEID